VWGDKPSKPRKEKGRGVFLSASRFERRYRSLSEGRIVPGLGGKTEGEFRGEK